MNKPLLTVIVPCYNVEKYIDKCISSIAGQAYTNLEIVLVNDGSTDNTGAICDSWQERDNRIRVIHKQNEGASYARKDAVDISLGEFVTFVDADDWIDVNMYADMMSAMLNTDSDIAVCSFCNVFEDGSIHVHCVSEEKKGTIEKVGKKEAILLILDNQIWYSMMCDKIFKKSLFQHVEFPKGRGLADDFITVFLFHHASQIVYLHNSYYYYLQRTGSICHPVDTQMKLKNIIDHSDAYFERYLFVSQHPEYHAALPFVKSETIKFTQQLLYHIIVFPQHFTKEYYKTKAEQLRAIPITREDNYRRRTKIEMKVLKISPKLYKILTRIILFTNRLKITNRRLFIHE